MAIFLVPLVVVGAIWLACVAVMGGGNVMRISSLIDATFHVFMAVYMAVAIGWEIRSQRAQFEVDERARMFRSNERGSAATNKRR